MHIYLHGHINKKNYWFWAHENPCITEIEELKPRKVTVWYALSAKQIFGPVFIEENLTRGRLSKPVEVRVSSLVEKK